MAKIQSLSISEFMAHGFPPVENQFVAHVKKHKHTYIRVGGAVVATVLIADCSMLVHASTGTAAIDIKAHKIYSRLCSIGKWVIVIRGGIDIISCISQGELDLMKKKMVTYVVGFLMLLGLPWLLDQAQALIDDPDLSLTT